MSSNLTRLEKQNEILARKLKKIRKAQQDAAKEQKNLNKELNQARLLKLGAEIQRVGYPVEKLPLILGLAIYGKELLENDEDAENKRQILSFMEKYQNYAKEQEAKKKASPPPPSDEEISQTMDDDAE